MVDLPDRVRGGMFGLLVGDALGVPYEFHEASELPDEAEIEMEPPQGFHPAHSVPFGTWSDDGAQTLCLLDSLLRQGRLDTQDFAGKLVEWMSAGLWALDGYVFDVGGQTRAAISALQRGVPPAQSGFVLPDGKGNGALMRVLPLALWHRGLDNDLVADAHRQAIVTHGHLTNQVCCALYCLWARRLLQGLPQAEAYENAVGSLRQIYGDVSDYREELEAGVRPEASPSTDGGGFVVSTLHCARLALRESSFEQVLRKAISYGRDTDTNAAVAGGLAGILYGVDAIPKRWLTALRGKTWIMPLLDSLVAQLRNISESNG